MDVGTCKETYLTLFLKGGQFVSALYPLTCYDKQ